MVIATCLLAVTFLAIACDNGDDNSGPKVPDLQLHPDPTATDLPSGALTGIPELDSVLGALFSGDEEAIQALVAFTPVACEVEAIGLGSPPQCLDDEPDGALVDVYPHGYCEGV